MAGAVSHSPLVPQPDTSRRPEQNKNSNNIDIEHLAFGTEEAVYEYQYDKEPISFPVRILTEILKRCNGSKTTLKILNLEHLRIVGTNQQEFQDAFDQLSRCSSMCEFVFRSCTFQVDNELRAANAATATATDNGRIFNRMFQALNEINALEVIVINNDDGVISLDGDDFPDIFTSTTCSSHNHQIQKQKQTQKQKRRKQLKVLSLSSCALSDHFLEKMFGEKSRVEKLCLVDTITSTHQLRKIADLLRTQNQSIKYLNIRSSEEECITAIPETLELLKALECNNTLKYIHLEVNCDLERRGDGANVLNSDTAHSFIDAIQKLGGLQILALDFSHLGTAVKSKNDITLQHISSILRNGLSKNQCLKKFSFVLASFHRMAHEDQEKFKKSMTAEINKSLIHALSSAPSSSKNEKKRMSCHPSSVLEDYRFYIDGNFLVKPNPTTKFWLSMNQKDMRQTLHRHPDDFKLWRDAIIEHNKNNNNNSNKGKGDKNSNNGPDIIYHLLRQNHALLIHPTR